MTPKATKLNRAEALLERARECGCVASLKGDWVVFKPPLPIDLMLEAIDISNEIARLVSAHPAEPAPQSGGGNG